MRLNYIWISSYKNIAKQGFTLSDEFRYYYDDLTGELTIEDNERYIPDLYGTNITALSAVLGMNGAGKSSLLEFLLLRLGTHSDHAYVTYEYGLECIVIFDKEIFCHDNLQISNEAVLERGGYTVQYFNDSLAQISSNRKSSQIAKKANNIYDYLMVYYSNVFDQQYVFDTKPSLNISTKELLYIDAYEAPGFRTATLSKASERINPITAHKLEELRRQMDFISSKIVTAPFKLPSQIVLALDDKRSLNFGKDDKWFRNNDLEGIMKVKEWLNNISDGVSGRRISLHDFKQFFVWLFRFRLLVVLAVQYPESLKRISFQECKDFVLNDDDTILRGLLQEPLAEAVSTIQSTLLKVIYSAKVPEHWLVFHTGNIWEDMAQIIVGLDKDDSQELYQLLENYKLVVGGYHFLSFHWEGLSSGENNMLVFYSRFYSIRNKPELIKAQQLIILIDEGETYFHPEWQRRYLEMVIEYLSVLFQGKEIQLILTSNSPFIASDIPKSKINFLKVDNGQCKVLSGDELEQIGETFGANIHSLYTSAFFIPDTLMGEFARRQIDTIIETLNRRGTSISSSRIRQLIEIIGEPIIRNLLLQMLENDNQ
ncbi:AAA family ATPase [Chitinophaga ginsengisoli]|uniref:Putative AbiEii toxin of type IV toxin-antitoxin system n=1 Tax=Chitinophaga ginsengisoli TaxID=363837 RepID=A0A2P8FXL2_9BACT|nr:AAA family ATPase [Chitinophaga ginsengisoli]PSL26454.1 putative AbiEii toxin of type IV toxin-antitoxin system [Chitinophaga ginsengisoli]